MFLHAEIKIERQSLKGNRKTEQGDSISLLPKQEFKETDKVDADTSQYFDDGSNGPASDEDISTSQLDISTEEESKEDEGQQFEEINSG